MHVILFSLFVFFPIFWQSLASNKTTLHQTQAMQMHQKNLGHTRHFKHVYLHCGRVRAQSHNRDDTHDFFMEHLARRERQIQAGGARVRVKVWTKTHKQTSNRSGNLRGDSTGKNLQTKHKQTIVKRRQAGVKNREPCTKWQWMRNTGCLSQGVWHAPHEDNPVWLHATS